MNYLGSISQHLHSTSSDSRTRRVDLRFHELEVKGKKVCTCPMRDILVGGCKCGGV